MVGFEFENSTFQNIVDVNLRLLTRWCLVEAFFDKSDESIEIGFAFSPHESVLLFWVVAFEHVQEEHYRLLAQRIHNLLTDAFNSRCKISSDLDALKRKQPSDNKIFNILDRKHLFHVRSNERVKVVN